MILSLKRITNTRVDLIYLGDDYIGLIGLDPVVRNGKTEAPKIVLDSQQTEQTVERIKDLVNKHRGTNRDIGVIKPPPRLNDPRIIDYMRRKHGRAYF